MVHARRGAGRPKCMYVVMHKHNDAKHNTAARNALNKSPLDRGTAAIPETIL